MDSNVHEGRKTEKLMASAINANRVGSSFQYKEKPCLSDENDRAGKMKAMVCSAQGSTMGLKLEEPKDLSFCVGRNPTEYGAGPSGSKPSGVSHNSSKQRRRPYIRKRQEQQWANSSILQELYGKGEGAQQAGNKRKISGDEMEIQNAARRKESRVIPSKGSPKSR